MGKISDLRSSDLTAAGLGRLAHSGAIMTHSLVKKFCRKSGMVVLYISYRCAGENCNDSSVATYAAPARKGRLLSAN
jgi:hypothetical protein